jgi:hypothetical protein
MNILKFRKKIVKMTEDQTPQSNHLTKKVGQLGGAFLKFVKNIHS